MLAQDMKPEAGKLYNEGNKYLKAGNYSAAIDDYNKAIAIQKDYRTYYQLGIALKNSGKLGDALTAFQESIKLKPEFEAANNALGGVYFTMGKYQESVDSFEKVLDSNAKPNVKATVKKNLALAYAKMGNVAVTDGHTDKAVDYLEKAVSYDNYDAAYLSLAKVYDDLAKYDKALDAAEKALKYKSTISSGGPYYYMGVAYKGKGNTEKAKEMFTKAKSDAQYKKTAEYELTSLQ